MEVYQLIFRTLLTFIILYVIARILGKKLISQMTFFDFVAGVSIGSITASLIFTTNIPILTALLPLVIFGIIIFVFDLIAIKSFKGRKILTDEPTLVIKNGQILEEGMTKARLNVDQLLLQLRKKNVFYLDEVEFAFLETDGTVSAMKKTDKQPLTKKDYNIISPSRGLPQTIVIDGQVLENSLDAIGKDIDWLNNTLQAKGISSIQEVVVAQLDQQDTLYLDVRKDKL
ncbi:DUF421 domain-containing protein [Aquibacillus sp. 3ASR75-11]|uniref:DUF421 domain-containing protein n=1 Tax=Terrihalobacillus insolitus TaxID=2950438 RepID=A0A9X3WWI1_9BACI|nr:DUF421 domain-containing protein [Terrihalobacillus insolitus]MDC3413549.1 DUF421 domain-containing protein [Terrihalobacillus insolitus]MDC3424694.1 DUF421 domain-containing protein [Terrihalobacillus insolitus]